MNVEMINPFISSLLNVINTMTQMTATTGKPFIKREGNDDAKGVISGVIGLVGKEIRGSMSITFSESVILQIASQMLGEEFTKINNDIADAVGEITNMVTGGARKALSEKFKFAMAIPTVIMGTDHVVAHKSSNPIIVIPFETDFGKFFIEVCYGN